MLSAGWEQNDTSVSRRVSFDFAAAGCVSLIPIEMVIQNTNISGLDS